MQRAAYAVVRCLSVRPSVMFLNSVKTNKHASIFFTIGSYTFHYVSFIPAPVGCVLRLFSAVTPADVVASVKAVCVLSAANMAAQEMCRRHFTVPVPTVQLVA